MIDVAILIVFILCILAGYYRGTIYAAINIGITVLSFFLALLMVPAAAGIVKKSDTLYKGMLYYFEGYSVAEISEILSANENTVKSRLKRARELLKGDFLNEHI